jgi:predicted dehydrogenase
MNTTTSSSQINSSEKKLSVALIGVGGQGASHLRALQSLPGVEVCALCDLRAEAIDVASKNVGPSTILSTDPLSFVETVECDCAVVIVPNPARMPLLKTLLARRIPLLIEKPATHTLEDLDQLLAWQRASGVRVMVGHNYRFMTGALAVSEQLRKGTIGKVLDVHGFFKRNHAIAGLSYYGKLEGPLPFRIEMVVHHMDLVRGWVGGSARSIFADGRRTSISWGVGETCCDVLAAFDNGVRLNYHGDWSAPANLTDFAGQWTLTGEEGCIHLRNDKVQVRRWHPEHVTWDEGEQWEITPAKGCDDSILGVHKEWFESLRQDREPACSLADAAESLRLCLAAATQHGHDLSPKQFSQTNT